MRLPSPKDLQVIPAAASRPPNSTATKNKTSASIKVKILHIPVKRFQNKQKDIDTTKFQKKSRLDSRAAELEEELGYVPDRQFFQDKNIKWKHRILVDRTFHDKWLPKKYRGRYFMYKSMDSTLELQANENFSRVEDACVYGDAFVFGLEEPGFSESGRVRYGQMAKDLDQSAISNILCRLAIEPYDD